MWTQKILKFPLQTDGRANGRAKSGMLFALSVFIKLSRQPQQPHNNLLPVHILGEWVWGNGGLPFRKKAEKREENKPLKRFVIIIGLSDDSSDFQPKGAAPGNPRNDKKQDTCGGEEGKSFWNSPVLPI